MNKLWEPLYSMVTIVLKRMYCEAGMTSPTLLAFQKKGILAGMVAHTSSSSTSRELRVQGQPGINSKTLVQWYSAEALGSILHITHTHTHRKDKITWSSQIYEKTKTKTVELGAQWLVPVILAIWEAETRRITVLGQPGQKSLQDPISMRKKAGCGGTCLSSQWRQEA
jgi:hypothetical protein